MPATSVQTGPTSPYGIGLTFRAPIHPENFHPHSTYFPLPRQSYLTHFTFPTVHFVKPYSVSTISLLSSVKPIPRMDKYPIVNNPGVYQSGQPNLLCNIQTISLVLLAQTIPSPSIFEIFQHHDAILGLASCERPCQDQARAPKLAPGTSSRNFGMPTLLKMTLASRFITWDSEVIYISPPFVSLSTISTSHRLRAPEVTSDAATLKGVDSTSSTKSKPSSAAATRSVREEMRQTV